MSDCESIASTMSEMSIVSYTGIEMDANDYVDKAFKDIQDAVNNCHCAVRNLIQSDDRGDTYEEAKQQFDEIAEVSKEGAQIFKEIVKTAKQLLPPKPKIKKDATMK